MGEASTIPLARLLTLRQFPFLAAAELEELVMFAENLVATTFAGGTEIAAPGGGPPSLHLILDGQIATTGDASTRGPREVFGMLEVLAGASVAAPAFAVGETRTLSLAAAECLEVLEDSYGLLRNLLGELAARVLTLPGRARASTSTRLVVPSGRLTLVERLIVLRRHLSFAGARLQSLAALAQASIEVAWAPGERVIRAGERAHGSLVILDGVLRPTCCDAAPVLGTGDALGGLETLAGLRHVHTYEATTPVRALWSEEAALLDVLEDHTDLALALVGRLARALLAAGVQLEGGRRSRGLLAS